MICLGYTDTLKDKTITDFCENNNIKKVFVLSPERYYFKCLFKNTEFIEYADIIRYIYYYRLLQEIDNSVLVVVNECLQTKNRNDLTYNCIRNFLNQTDKQIIFNYVPIIESVTDFFILFDFDTRSKWKRETDFELLQHSTINTQIIDIKFNEISIQTTNKVKAEYQKTKEKLIQNIGLKDPHTIPRNLYLISGKTKVQCLDKSKYYIGRNNRFALDNIETYNAYTYKRRYIIFEFCHNYIDFCNFIAKSDQIEYDVLVTDLKVDRWYFERYLSWSNVLKECYATIRQNQKCP
jgi:hypothetical protein